MQTATEWLFKHIENVRIIDEYEFIKLQKAFEQAKQMEKQQIIKSILMWDVHTTLKEEDKGSMSEIEEFVNETYGSKGSDDNHAYCGMIDCKCTTFSQTEISDEEIEREAENAWSDYEYEEGNLYSTTFKGGWKLAIKWYREQLKKK